MKRHESIAPLSREHHAALILAQLLKKDAPVYKGLPTVASEKVVYALNMFNDELKEHFRKEELIIERAKHCHEDILKLGNEIITEHQQLTGYFLGLNKATDTEDALNTLGIALETHIRKEERLLFPLIQEHCSEDLMKELGVLLNEIPQP